MPKRIYNPITAMGFLAIALFGMSAADEDW